ncbi:MAG: hypothetical protein KC646_17440 [Candidatus Cloacimonetes bacterium]|nr:hypothetical protein [Candidatus Cloacimonadota bacterium]
MIFWFLLLIALATTMGLFSFSLTFLDHRTTKKVQQKELLHKDAQVVAQLAHEHLGTPSTALVRSKFCDLRFSQKSARYLSGLNQLKKQDYDNVINTVENKFIRIDRSIYKISSMCKSKKSLEYQKEFIASHESKYDQILNKIDRLMNSKNETNFLKVFLALNEYINAYIAQVETQKTECQKIDDPSIYHWA